MELGPLRRRVQMTCLSVADVENGPLEHMDHLPSKFRSPVCRAIARVVSVQGDAEFVTFF
jgi:hypothetical protein